MGGSILNDENGVHYGSTLTRVHWKTLNVDYTSLQTKHKRAIIENFLMINDCFNCVTSGIMALGWLENKEEKAHADSWILTVSGRLPRRVSEHS